MFVCLFVAQGDASASGTSNVLELMKIFREEQRQVCFTLWLCVNELVLRDSRKRYNGPTLIDRCTDRQTCV